VTIKMSELQAKIDGFMNSDRPGKEVVPLAIYYRYVLRTVANRSVSSAPPPKR